MKQFLKTMATLLLALCGIHLVAAMIGILTEIDKVHILFMLLNSIAAGIMSIGAMLFYRSFDKK